MTPSRELALVPDAAIDRAIDNADAVLRQVGVRIVDEPDVVELFVAAGLEVVGDRVRCRLGQLRDIAGSAPSTFVQHARDPTRSVAIGARDGRAPVFIPVYGPPNVRADDGVRRLATMADYRVLVAMADAAPAIGNTGHMLCVPDDVPEAERYDEMVRAHLTSSCKPLMGSTASEASAATSIRLTDEAFGSSSRGDCRLLFLCNSIPPLTYTSRMLGVLRAAASTGQGSLVTSFQMLGATGPAAVLGALSQGIAEVMLGVALTQLIRPAAPAVFGLYGVPFDMRTMLPRGGDPISSFVQSGAVQVARRFGLPALGYGGVTSAKTDDAQAGSESGLATRMAVSCGADVVLHAAGWLENGRTAGFAKFRREAAALLEWV